MAIDKIYEDLKNADVDDTTRFKRIPTPEIILRARNKMKQQAEMQSTDDAKENLSDIFPADVVALLRKHAGNSQDMERINGVLRAMLN